MARLIDLLAVSLLLVGCAAALLAVHEVGAGRDFRALYWVAVGGAALRGCVALQRSSATTS